MSSVFNRLMRSLNDDRRPDETPSPVINVNPFSMPIPGWDAPLGQQSDGQHQAASQLPEAPVRSRSGSSMGGTGSYELVEHPPIETPSCRSSMSIISMQELEEDTDEPHSVQVTEPWGQRSASTQASSDSQEANMILQGNIVDTLDSLEQRPSSTSPWQPGPPSPDPFLDPSHSTATNPIFNEEPAVLNQAAPARTLLSWLRGGDDSGSPAGTPTHRAPAATQQQVLSSLAATQQEQEQVPSDVDMVSNPVFSAGGAGGDEEGWEMHIQAPSLAMLAQMAPLQGMKASGLLRARSLPLISDTLLPDHPLMPPPLEALGQAIENLKDERDELAGKLLSTDAALMDEQAQRRQAHAEAAAQRALVAQLLAAQEQLQQQLTEMEASQRLGGGAMSAVGALSLTWTHLEQLKECMMPALVRTGRRLRAFSSRHAGSLSMIGVVVTMVLCILFTSWVFVQQGLQLQQQAAFNQRVLGSSTTPLLSTQRGTRVVHHTQGARTWPACGGGGAGVVGQPPAASSSSSSKQLLGINTAGTPQLSASRFAALMAGRNTTQVSGCGDTCPSLPALFGIALPSAALPPAMFPATSSLPALHMEHTCLPRAKKHAALPSSNALPPAPRLGLSCLNTSPAVVERFSPVPYAVEPSQAPEAAQPAQQSTKATRSSQWGTARIIALHPASRWRYQQALEQLTQRHSGRTARVHSQAVGRCWSNCSTVGGAGQAQQVQEQLMRIRLQARSVQIRHNRDVMKAVLQDLHQALASMARAPAAASEQPVRSATMTPSASTPHTNVTQTVASELPQHGAYSSAALPAEAHSQQLNAKPAPSASSHVDNRTVLALAPSSPVIPYMQYVQFITSQQKTHKLLAGLPTPPASAPLACILPAAMASVMPATATRVVAAAAAKLLNHTLPSLPLKTSAWRGRVQLPVMVRPSRVNTSLVPATAQAAWSKLFQASQERLAALMARHYNTCRGSRPQHSQRLVRTFEFIGVIEGTHTTRPGKPSAASLWPAATARFLGSLMAGANTSNKTTDQTAATRPAWPFERRRCKHIAEPLPAGAKPASVKDGILQQCLQGVNASLGGLNVSLDHVLDHVFKAGLKYLHRVTGATQQPAHNTSSAPRPASISKAIIRVDSALAQLAGMKRRVPMWSAATTQPVLNHSLGRLGLQWLQTGSALSAKALNNLDEALLRGTTLLGRRFTVNTTTFKGNYIQNKSSLKAVVLSMTGSFNALWSPSPVFNSTVVNTTTATVPAVDKPVVEARNSTSFTHLLNKGRIPAQQRQHSAHANVRTGANGSDEQTMSRKAASTAQVSAPQCAAISELKPLRHLMAATWSKVQVAAEEVQHELGRCFACLGHESHSVCGTLSKLLGANKRWIDTAVRKHGGSKAQCPAFAGFSKSCKCRSTGQHGKRVGRARPGSRWTHQAEPVPACCCLKDWKAVHRSTSAGAQSNVLLMLQKLQHHHQLPWMRKVVRKAAVSHAHVEAQAQELAQAILDTLQLLNVSSSGLEADWVHPTSSNTTFWQFASGQLSGRIPSGTKSSSAAFRKQQRHALSKVASSLRHMRSALHQASSSGSVGAHVLSSSLPTFKQLQRALVDLLNQLNLLQMRLGSPACSPRDPARRYVSEVRQQVQAMATAARELTDQVQAATNLCDASHTHAQDLLPVIMGLNTKIKLARAVQ